MSLLALAAAAVVASCPGAEPAKPVRKGLGLAGAMFGIPAKTPYQEMGFMGGVSATQITADTFQISARGNAYTSADAIQRYALRKAAETTIAAGYDLFLVEERADRSTAYGTTFGRVSGDTVTARTNVGAKPGHSMMIQVFKGERPADAPGGLYDAREVLCYLSR